MKKKGTAISELTVSLDNIFNGAYMDGMEDLTGELVRELRDLANKIMRHL